jgi:hypothetical protein
MLQREHDFFHRHVSFEDEPARVKQGKACDQTQDKMTVVTNGVSFLQTTQ